MVSLYDDGWRQGSIFDADLPLNAVVLGPSGDPEPNETTHSLWVVASQDCDLDGAENDADEPCIELRPVYTQNPPADWGIRSNRLRLTDDEYIVSTSPRQHVAPAVLTALSDRATDRRLPDEDRRQAFTTWLGLRYDRPAVPPHLVTLARRISQEVAAHRNRSRTASVRDVLMQFDDAQTPVRYSLFAVLDDSADEDAIRALLAEIGHAVPTALGVLDRSEAATAERMAFSTIEQSYAADVTRVTWRPDQPSSEGAT